MLCDPLAGGGGAIVTDVVYATSATWLRILVVGRLDARDPHLHTIAAPERPVTIVHLYNFTDEGWR